MSFDELRHLHLLWVVVALAGVYLYGFAQKRRALQRFATANLFAQLMPTVSGLKQRFKAVLTLAAMALIVFALVGPRWGRYVEEVRRRGIDIMICLDASRSMLAEDIAPNRLERAKMDVRELLRVLPGDRVGLITFGGKPVLKCPLTADYGYYRLMLDEISSDSVPVGGSMIGDAVRKAADSFDDKEKNHKAIVLITDGEDHDSYPGDAARDAFEQKGIRVFTIGIGDAAEGQRIPIQQNGRKAYLQYEGQEWWSKMNPETLREMGVRGGGAYVPAGTANIDIEGIYRDHIATLEKKEFEERKIVRQRPQFQWFAGLAFLLLVLETMTSERKHPATQRKEMRWAA